MTKMLPRVLALAGVAAGAMIAALPAAAQTYTFAGGTVPASTCDPGSGAGGASAFSTVSCTVSSNTVKLSAWSYSGTGSTWNQGNLGDFDANGMGAYSGRGEDGTGSHHAFDNKTSRCSGSYGGSNYGGAAASGGGGTKAIASTSLPAGCGGSIEAMLMSFTGNYALNKLTIGYRDTDADLSVYAWVGTGAPDLATKTKNDGTTVAAAQTVNTAVADSLGGWVLIGSNNMGGAGCIAGTTTPVCPAGTNVFTLGTTVFSSYFLVTTYFGATTASLTAGDDAFKINQFSLAAQPTTGCTAYGAGTTAVLCSGLTVPEPASMALIGFGLLGAGFARRQALARARAR